MATTTDGVARAASRTSERPGLFVTLATGPEGESFWLRGRRADAILRAPLEQQPDGRWTGRQIAKFTIRVQNGIKVNEVRIDTTAAHDQLTMQPSAQRTVTLAMPAGFPYRAYETPTSYAYVVSFSTSAGFAPFLETPPSGDARFPGAQITWTPEFR